MKYRGTAYYPEVWDKSRWDEDVRLMKEAGINLVRMTEFAWSKLEPEEGVFDFEWLKDILRSFEKENVKVMLCTPSAAYPNWMFHRYPEVRAVPMFGEAPADMERRSYCQNSPVYRQFVKGVVENMAEVFKGYSNVIAWQIDNELAPHIGDRGDRGHCTCKYCMEGFRKWLKKKYGTLEELNKAWNLGFWSREYSSWEQITGPYVEDNFKQDYSIYQSETYADFAYFQYEILKETKKEWIVTTNISQSLSGRIDHAEMFERLDIASYDAYIDNYDTRQGYTAVYDTYRNLKKGKSFWITECGTWNWACTDVNQQMLLKPWAYHSFAHGGEARVYFRWRQSIMGEHTHPAILDWSGRPGPVYNIVKDINKEFERLEEEFKDLPLPAPEAAILMDSQMGYTVPKEEYKWRIAEASSCLNNRQCPADILSIRLKDDLSKYKLIVLPRFEMVDADMAEKLRSFVEQGGILLSTPRLGMKDRNSKYVMETHPQGLTELFGIEIIERQVISSAPRSRAVFEEDAIVNKPVIDIKLDIPHDASEVLGKDWMEHALLKKGTEVLGSYTTGRFQGKPVLTWNNYGKGAALYMTCWLNKSAYQAVIDYAMRLAGISFNPEIPETVEVIDRGNITFYINYGLESTRVKAKAEGTVLLGKAGNGFVQLEPADVCIIKKNRD